MFPWREGVKREAGRQYKGAEREEIVLISPTLRASEKPLRFEILRYLNEVVMSSWRSTADFFTNLEFAIRSLRVAS